MSKLPVNPFEMHRYIGIVFEVTPNKVKIYLSSSSCGVRVGELIFIACDNTAVFGKVIFVKLSEKEKFIMEQELGKEDKYSTIAEVQLLATVNVDTGKVERGIKNYPRVGSKVYFADPQLITWVVEASLKKEKQRDFLTLEVAHLQDYTETLVRVLPEQLFSRHCAILGTTGGGKSWTIARLIEEVNKHQSKTILLDPSGEYYTLNKDVVHFHFGEEKTLAENSQEVVFPYSSLTENDLFAIFAPTGLQVSKLRAAMKSLKLARLEPWLAKKGVIVKANQPKNQYEQLYRQYSKIIESPSIDFDITKLTSQIEEECIWNTNRTFPNKWGGYNNEERSSCVSLLSRIEDVITSPDLSCVFQPQEKQSVLTEIDKFFVAENVKTLRISLENVSFSHNAREVIVNALGRYILEKARAGCFLKQPLVVFLDEAHHFLNQSIDGETKYKLDSF